MEKSLTPNQIESISERINNLSFPSSLKDCKIEFKIYKDNLFEIYRFEILGGNADYLELLRNNNFRIIRKHVEGNGKNQSVYMNDDISKLMIKVGLLEFVDHDDNEKIKWDNLKG